MSDLDEKFRQADQRLYLMHISVHGLIRGEEPELGRDADTGGQVLYVLELVRQLAQDRRVGRVDLLTRQVCDADVAPCYGVPMEALGERAFLRRLSCGPQRYLKKEQLWRYVDLLVDQAIGHIRWLGRVPDVIHGHYADGGYVGRQLARLLGRPFIFTGHSLGRVKRQKLLERGMAAERLERVYQMSRRIEAEELSLDAASMVVASTQQEVAEQYELYEQYVPSRMRVIAPGVNLQRFSPPHRGSRRTRGADLLRRFFREPERPLILALARADEKKNLQGLVHAFGQSEVLRRRCNLAIVAGNRHDIEALDKGARRVMTELLLLVDRYDLYGQVALPKQHEAEDVPDFYRFAAATRGVFVNVAFNEPFGLTLLEAAASGLPVVATQDGGPPEILRHCGHGVLVPPEETGAVARALEQLVGDEALWRRCAESGIKGSRAHYSWQAHVSAYLRQMGPLLQEDHYRLRDLTRQRRHLPLVNRVLVTDIDGTLLGDAEAVKRFCHFIRNRGDEVAFGIATGRHLASTLAVLREWRVPKPDFLITSVGAAIHYEQHGELVEDTQWDAHLRWHWNPQAVREALSGLEGLTLQEADAQHPFKVSYTLASSCGLGRREVWRVLRARGLRVHVIQSHGVYLDVLPVRASKGSALRHVLLRWGIPPSRALAAGDSGNDHEMLRGENLGVVVGNYLPELENLRGSPRIYFAKARHAAGILEGVAYYDFMGEMRAREEETEEAGAKLLLAQGVP